MDKVSGEFPNWRLKIKEDTGENVQKPRPQIQNYQMGGQYQGVGGYGRQYRPMGQMNPYHGQMPMPLQYPPMQNMQNNNQMRYQQNYVQHNQHMGQNDKGEIFGHKQYNIMVR